LAERALIYCPVWKKWKTEPISAQATEIGIWERGICLSAWCQRQPSCCQRTGLEGVTHLVPGCS
jgi:hypothetical protein